MQRPNRHFVPTVGRTKGSKKGLHMCASLAMKVYKQYEVQSGEHESKIGNSKQHLSSA